ncbi:MAG: hypothetical protein ACM3P1_13645 [Candidatus Saccharibacteria bacterium]
MKQTIILLSIVFGLLGLVPIDCPGSPSYTVQVVASKTPTDIESFCSSHQLESKVYEFKENGWYKYVTGQFNDLSEASHYITHDLAFKDLQGPFPRTLSDSMKVVMAHAVPPDTVTPNPQIARADSLPVKDSSSYKPSIKTPALQLSRAKIENNQKYGPWAKIIGLKQVHNAEMAIIKGAGHFLPKAWMPFYGKMIDKAIRYPVILFFILLIIGFILNAILIIITLELSNTIKNRLERFDQLYTQMYERALTGYIFQEYDLEGAVKRIKHIKYPRNRKVLIAVLFNFKKNLSGDLNEKLLDVFFKLEMEKDSIRKTESYSFYRRILGIRELTNLFPKIALPVVEAHINDENDELRAEAQTSYVRLNQEEPFRFLGSLRKPFTRWTQLTSFYIFRLHKLPAPSFVEYLKSDLYNVQNFSLRMIIFFQQIESAQEIIKMLDAQREMTRFLAIRAVNELGIQEAKPRLKEMYPKETYKNQLEIIKGFLHTGDAGDFDFLENIIRQKDITLKIEACRSMYFMSTPGKEKLLSLKEEKELDLEPFIAHIHDPRN